MSPKKSAAPTPPTPRRYRSTRREQQAAQTRQDVLFAAVRCFAAHGWSGTTMAAIAAEADVAVETIYSGFGSKKQLLRQAMDVAIVGDAEPIPLAARPEWARMGEGTVAERVHAGIQMLAGTHERSAAIWSALRDAAGSDAEVAQWCTEMEETRRGEVARSLELIFGRRVAELDVDMMWALFGPEVYLKLVRELGWSRERYERHLSDATLRLLT